MFGWEYPPVSSGGLGTACYGLTRGLSNQGIEISFVLPYAPSDVKADYVKLIPAGNLKKVKLIGVNSVLHAYINSTQYRQTILKYNRRQAIVKP